MCSTTGGHWSTSARAFRQVLNGVLIFSDLKASEHLPLDQTAGTGRSGKGRSGVRSPVGEGQPSASLAPPALRR